MTPNLGQGGNQALEDAATLTRLLAPLATADGHSVGRLIVALDRSHERILSSWARTPDDADKLTLLMAFDETAGGTVDVPDPYYAGPEMFDEVLAMIESASRALFRQLEPAIRPPS